jgi:hypothetical protein
MGEPLDRGGQDTGVGRGGTGKTGGGNSSHHRSLASEHGGELAAPPATRPASRL